MAVDTEQLSIDTLPEAERDWIQTYQSFVLPKGTCRVRLYHDTDGVPLIVCTDLDDENKGPSVTNAAESCQLEAWIAAGRPWPCRFFEHYRGVVRNRRVRQADDLDDEHIDEVEFGFLEPAIAVRGTARHSWQEFQVVGGGPNWKRMPIQSLKECIGG